MVTLMKKEQGAVHAPASEVATYVQASRMARMLDVPKKEFISRLFREYDCCHFKDDPVIDEMIGALVERYGPKSDSLSLGAFSGYWRRIRDELLGGRTPSFDGKDYTCRMYYIAGVMLLSKPGSPDYERFKREWNGHVSSNMRIV